MDWIHCNICFSQPGMLPKRDFMLTSCGHIFCLRCEQSGIIEQCKMCHVKCTTVPLKNEMAPEVMAYFVDQSETLEKVVKAWEFQKSHRDKLMENYRKICEKYMHAKVLIQRLEEEKKNLKIELESYKNRTSIITPPPPQPEHPLFSRNSQASQVIRMGASQANSSGVASPFFATPSRIPNFSSQQFRSQQSTPATPASDLSSPASQASGHTYRSQNDKGRVTAPILYRSHLTPPVNSLSMMYLRSPHHRNISRN